MTNEDYVTQKENSLETTVKKDAASTGMKPSTAFGLGAIGGYLASPYGHSALSAIAGALTDPANAQNVAAMTWFSIMGIYIWYITAPPKNENGRETAKFLKSVFKEE